MAQLGKIRLRRHVLANGIENHAGDILCCLALDARGFDSVGKVQAINHSVSPTRPPIYCNSTTVKAGCRSAAAELAEAHRLHPDGVRWSVAQVRTFGKYQVPEIRALFKASVIRSWRKTGLPEQ
jgi:hypothetical protein